jgi:UDP-glucose 4-epimerase
MIRTIRLRAGDRLNIILEKSKEYHDFPKYMRILLTGGSGFIGSHLAERLLKDNHEVICIDNLSTGSLQNIQDLSKNDLFHHHTSELLSAAGIELLKNEVLRCDVIYHLAAAVGVFNVVNHPAKTIKENIEITETLLNFAKGKNKKIVLFSTSEVYGKSTKLPFNEDDDIVLGPSKNSRWSYAASKLVDEFLGFSYFKQYNLPVVIVRLFNTVGPKQVGHYGMVIPRFVRQALDGDEITIYGSGKQSRCFCNVKDTVEALVSLIHNDDCFGQIFNIGSSHEITIEDLAEKIIHLTGSDSNVVYVPYEEAYSEGFEDMMKRVPDCTKIESYIGWKPKIDLEETILQVINHMKM